MTQNAETPRAESGAFQEDLAGGEAAPIVPHGTNSAHQGDALFPGEPTIPIARPVVVMTTGRIEYAARCPKCRTWHRHISLGEKDAPCGAHYLLQPKAKLKGAA